MKMMRDHPSHPGAYDLLRAEILHGALMPGERLTVSGLNARYNLGLTPIREALMRLTSEGLVQNAANRGARVRDTTVEELHDLMSTRRELERACLRMAIERGDAGWEAEILRTVHLLSRAPFPASAEDRGVAEEWERLHRQFHRALVSACGSQWRLRFWDTLADHSERYRKLRLLVRTRQSPSRETAQAEHEAIVEAILARDTGRTLALMDDHLARTEAAVAVLLADLASHTQPRRKPAR